MKFLVWTMVRGGDLVVRGMFAAPHAAARGSRRRRRDGAARRSTAALDELDAWLGDGDNGDRWRAYLHADELRAELAKGAEADPAVVARSLQRFRGDADGLELAPFAAGRRGDRRLARGAAAASTTDDLAKLAWASRGDHTPISEAQFAAVRADLRNKAQALGRARWRRPAAGRRLEGVPAVGPARAAPGRRLRSRTRKSLAELDEVLRRFRTNQPGLELPVFTDVAKAIARYRALASWAAHGQGARLAARLRALPRPTFSGCWSGTSSGRRSKRRGRSPAVLGVIDGLGQSPAVRARRARAIRPAEHLRRRVGEFRHARAQPRPSIASRPCATASWARASSARPTRWAACGTKLLDVGRLRRSWRSTSTATAHSRTRGYNGPVRINSDGATTYWAYQQVSLSDDEFIATPADGGRGHAHADSLDPEDGRPVRPPADREDRLEAGRPAKAAGRADRLAATRASACCASSKKPSPATWPRRGCATRTKSASPAGSPRRVAGVPADELARRRRRASRRCSRRAASWAPASRRRR